jgi:hypothetical protein
MTEGDDSQRVFISYAGPDRAWAEWVAWHLTEAGWSVELDVWNWAAGDNFVTKMQNALAQGQMVALFSAAYFDADRFTAAEWTAVLVAREKLVPLRIDTAAVPAILRPFLTASLVGLDEAEARETLLRAVAGPLAPTRPPVFPGSAPDRPSGPALPRQLPRVWNLPRRNPDFTGRNDLLTSLRTALTAERRSAMRVLLGHGGVGKTQLAVEYAHRFASEYELVWWVRAEEPALIPGQLAALAVKTGAAEKGTPVREALDALAEELRVRERWLLVFDDAPDPESLHAYLPEGAGHVLITSRDPSWQGGTVPVDVSTFTRAESIALLQARLDGVPLDDADRLADRLGDLPLALAQAVGVLGSGVTAARYLDLLQRNTETFRKHSPSGGYPKALGATVQLAMSRLEDDGHPAATALLRACALLAPEPFPLYACTHLSSLDVPLLEGFLDDRQQVLGVLARFGLARIQDGSVQVHPLTQAAIRAQMTREELADAAHTAEALLIAATPGDAADPATEQAWSAVVPHLLAMEPADLTTRYGRLVVREACRYLMERGQVRTALPRLKELFEVWSEQLGPDHVDSLWTADYLARACGEVGERIRARWLAEDTLSRRRRVLGEDHPDTLGSASNLAGQLGEAGEVAAARELNEDTLARLRKVLGEDHPRTLAGVMSLVENLTALGEWHAARALGEEVLVRRRRVLGEDHPDTLISAARLVEVLTTLGEWDAARALGEEVLVRRRQVLGDDHPHTLASAARLVEVLAALGTDATTRTLESLSDSAGIADRWRARVSAVRAEHAPHDTRPGSGSGDVAVQDGPRVAPIPYPSGAAVDRSRVFISAAPSDRSWADWVDWELTGWGHDVRRGAEQADPARSYALQVEDALRHVDVVIALVSPRYLASPSWTASGWSSDEVSAATARSRFAPLLVEPVEPGLLPETLREAMTPALQGLDAEAAREILQYVLRRPRQVNHEPAYPGAAPGASGRAAVLQSQLVGTLAGSPILADPASRRLWTGLISELVPAKVEFADYPTVLTHLTGVVRVCRATPGALPALVHALEMLEPGYPGLEEARRLAEEIERSRERR